MKQGQNDFDSLHNISPGKHLYQFYKGREDFLRTIGHYFQAGLEKGDACLCLVSEAMGLGSVYDYLSSVIPEGGSYLASGQLQVLSGEAWYLTQGSFDEDKAMANASQFLTKMQKQGFQILRGAGDAASIPHCDWPRVHAYEKRMAPWIKNQPVIALCAYPILQCSPSETRAVLDCHDDVLIGRL